MTITQTVDIPPSRRITINVPREVPVGRTILIFQPTEAKKLPSPLPGGNYSTIEEAMQAAEERAKDSNRKPISQLFGKLSPGAFGDPVAYQKAIRDEWDD